MMAALDLAVTAGAVFASRVIAAIAISATAIAETAILVGAAAAIALAREALMGVRSLRGGLDLRERRRDRMRQRVREPRCMGCGRRPRHA